MNRLAELNGILCIDKPAGFTSFDVVAKMRGIAKTRKIGHAGTLDPMATGVLPLFLGRATKACDILPRQDKKYLATFQLGLTTDTQDSTGTVLSRSPVTVGKAQVRAAAARFVGEIMQLPPMYSAVKVDGQRLYELARKGVQVERKARKIVIYSLEFTECNDIEHTYQIQVHCSKGTYIRTLIADIGEALGCGAVMTALRRTMAAGYVLEECITLAQAQQLADAGELGSQRLGAPLMPIGSAFTSLPRVFLGKSQARLFRNGVRLDAQRIQITRQGKPLLPEQVQGHLEVVSNKEFLGVAQLVQGELRLVKLFTLEE